MLILIIFLSVGDGWDGMQIGISLSRMSYNDQSSPCKQPKAGYFRQYRNHAKDASRKNGPYGHPRN